MMNQWRILCVTVAVLVAAILPTTAQAAMNDLRMWTAASSGKKVQASMQQVDGDDVVLKRSTDGKVFRLKISQLSEADQRYIAYHQENSAQPTETIPSDPVVADEGKTVRGTPTSSNGPSDAADDDLARLTSGTMLDGVSWSPTLAIILGLANIPLCFMWGKMFFGGFEGFWEAFGYVLKPDWISFWQGDGMEDWWATMKFNVFFVWCLITVVAQYIIIQKVF